MKKILFLLLLPFFSATANADSSVLTLPLFKQPLSVELNINGQTGSFVVDPSLEPILILGPDIVTTAEIKKNRGAGSFFPQSNGRWA